MALALKNYHQGTYVEIWYDCYLSDTKQTGFICTWEKDGKKHQFYGLNDLARLLKKAAKKGQDVYLSINSFTYGLRKTKELKQIRNIGIDLDFYKHGLAVPEAVQVLKQLIDNGTIPNPNLVIYSGRGLQLVYSISGGASPQMAFLSQYITSQYIGLLKGLHADTSATDVTRVFRLPFSINSKNGQQVTVEVWNKREFSLQELYEYCTPLENQRKGKKGKLEVLPAKKGVINLYSLNSARKNDLEALVRMRNGRIDNRNVLTYIYAYHVALLVKNQESTVHFVRQLNDTFSEPQAVKEAERTAKNAYKDAMEFFAEFKNQGFRNWYKMMDGIKKPMKNDTIIKQLDITPEEMQELETLIGKDVKTSRNTASKRKKRRSSGVKSRKEYLEGQKQYTDKQLEFIRKQLEINPKLTRKELAEMTGVSVYRVDKLKRVLKEK